MTSFFQKLFKNSRTAPEVPSRSPLAEGESKADMDPIAGYIEPPQFLVGCARSIGMQRDHNEDALFTLATTLASDSTLVPVGLFIVADGMGGHRHGEVASGIAVRTLAANVIQKIFGPVFAADPAAPEDSIQDILRDAVSQAHTEITQDAPGGGTTLTAVLVMGEQMVIAHVGDSRAYYLPQDGNLQALTRDHSLVRRLEELGQITPEEAAVHPQRNVLYRALGQGEPFEADIETLPLPDTGSLLLCSDGLWGVVPENQLASLARSETLPQQACQKMIDAANAAGGPDNITAVLVQLPQRKH